MASFNWPPSGGSGSGVTIYANFAAFPLPGSVPVGTLAIDASTGTLYEQFGGSWQILAQLGGGGGTPFQEIPSGAINNVNVNFTLANTPASNAALALFLDGLSLEQGVDYTILGTAITMTVAPMFGQHLYAIGSLSSGPSGGVDDVNGVIGSVIVAAGAGITVGTLGQTITITNTGPTTTVLAVDGTRAAPQLITAAGGLSFSGTQTFTKKYIAGNGGPVVVTANPQIAAGTVDGQQLVLQSRDATDTVQLSDGTGLSLNGAWIGGLDSSITLTWDTVNWVEMSRQ
jgi:hypothetical protein